MTPAGKPDRAGRGPVSLDIYYLIDASGHVVYVDSGPASTMSQLLARAAGLR